MKNSLVVNVSLTGPAYDTRLGMYDHIEIPEGLSFKEMGELLIEFDGIVEAFKVKLAEIKERLNNA